MNIGKRLLHSFSVVTLFSVTIPAPAADFVPETVFAGRSTGRGELRILLGKARPFTVESVGTLHEESTVLHQRVQFQGRAAESRTWVMRRANGQQYSASLTDAAGPVTARINGSRMTLRYPLKRWGLVMHQTLDLFDDTRTIENRGTIKLLGIPIGCLRETIHLSRSPSDADRGAEPGGVNPLSIRPKRPDRAPTFH